MWTRVHRTWLFSENKEYRSFDGCKIEIYDTSTNYVFWFLSRFLRVWLPSLKKVLIWHKKRIFLKNSKKGVKNAEFHADFESVEKVVKKCAKKKLLAKEVWRTWVNVKKVHFSVTILLIPFFGAFFQNFLTDSKSA